MTGEPPVVCCWLAFAFAGELGRPESFVSRTVCENAVGAPQMPQGRLSFRFPNCPLALSPGPLLQTGFGRGLFGGVSVQDPRPQSGSALSPSTVRHKCLHVLSVVKLLLSSGDRAPCCSPSAVPQNRSHSWLRCG